MPSSQRVARSRSRPSFLPPIAVVLWLAVCSSASAADRHFLLHYEPSQTAGELAIEANYYLWIPDGATILRGVIVHQHGCGDGAEKGGVTASRDLHWQALARKWNCALMGSSYRAKGQSCRLWCDARKGSGERFQQALAEFAKQTGHPELTSVPWCLWGHSGGAFWASLMQVKHHEKIVAIWLRSGTAFEYWQKGEIPKPEIPPAAYQVPVMCNPGLKEKDHKRFRKAWDGDLAMFKAYRAKGAPIGFAPDPLTAHECGDSRYAAIPFFDACLSMRLPKLGTSIFGLRPVDWKQAWYAELHGDSAQPADKFTGNKQTAVWLPNEQFAKTWSHYVKHGGPLPDATPPPSPEQVQLHYKPDGSLRITWTAKADFESGLGGFTILKNGQQFAKLPKSPKSRFGKPLFQGMSYHDTPTAPVAEMAITVPADAAGKGDKFAVVAMNTRGKSSKPATAFPFPSTVAEGAQLTEVYADPRFFEGPTADPKTGKLYFTAFGKDNQQILRLEEPGKVTVWLDKTEGVNGTFLSKDGWLLGAQAYGHRVMKYRFGKNGPAESQVLLFDNTLNQPNDVCQTPNGDIYFSDPDFKNRKTSAVYRLSPNGKTTRVVTNMPVPNGVITSLDGKTLYVGDSHEMLWRSYPIRADGTVGAGKVFFNPKDAKKSAPDGMAIDERGNLYFSGRGGVWVVDPEGRALGLIPVPEFCSNAGFGGKDGKTLYLTCSKKVYSLKMKVRGGRIK